MEGCLLMSTATDKLNDIQVWSNSCDCHPDMPKLQCIRYLTGECDEPIQPVVIPQAILEVLTAKPKPIRKPRK